jgi:hypothetical protein
MDVASQAPIQRAAAEKADNWCMSVPLRADQAPSIKDLQYLPPAALYIQCKLMEQLWLSWKFTPNKLSFYNFVL